MKLFGGLIAALLFSIHTFGQQNPKDSGYIILIPGIGFDDIKLAQTTREEIIRKYGEEFKIDTFYSVDIESGSKYLYSIALSYPNSGLSFYFWPHSSFIFTIDVKYPCKAKTKNGIVLNKSSFVDILKSYGPVDWTFTQNSYSSSDMHLEYDSLGVNFSQVFSDTIPVSDDKLKSYLNNKVTEISIIPIELDNSEEGR